MFKNIIVLIFILTGTVFAADDNDKDSCPPVPKHYKELGCKAVFETGKKCPSRFECPKITDRDGKKCYLNGNIYEPRDRLASDLTEPLCSAACFCSDFEEPHRFTCAQIECPELFGIHQPDCIKQYDEKSCCSKKTICEKAEIEKLDTCMVDGKKYYAGQKIYPESEPCYTCLCEKGFNNALRVAENPHCKEVNCGIELRYLHNLRAGCAPIYFGNARCCPIGWRCPEEKDEIVSTGRTTESPPSAEQQCSFGKLRLNVGDIVKSNDKCDECKCVLPPSVYCIHKQDC
uniref:Putative secreted protein n=1 Tax=Corethrella appendiculata TaxID=1370023 RepID=U5EL88_9DIPT